MSQRNLPPSFWISDYYQQHSQHLVHQQQQQQYDPYAEYMADPAWQNYMYHHHQRAASDVYSQASRQYSSLLHLQRSAIERQQQGRQVAAALGKAPNDTWAAAAAAGAAVDGFSPATSHTHYPVTGEWLFKSNIGGTLVCFKV